MTIELTARQALVRTLSGDLLAGPWDQPSKLYYLKGDSGDEWLEFAGEFTDDVDYRLADVVLEKQLPEDATGILVATEGWDYPQKLSTSLRAKGDAATRSYWSLYPPSKHPQRVSIRNLTLTCADGEVIGLTARQDDATALTWAHLDADVPCPTGNVTIDTARAALGRFPGYAEQIEQARSSYRAIRTITNTLKAISQGQLDENEATIQLLDAIPDEQRAQMFETMPEEIKESLRRTLNEDQLRRYGLD